MAPDQSPTTGSETDEFISRMQRFVRRIAACPEAAFGQAEVMEAFRDEAIALLHGGLK